MNAIGSREIVGEVHEVVLSEMISKRNQGERIRK
jgi:hypothetical protein